MIKVFLVEDETIIRNAIHEMIPWNKYGFELVGEAGDGEIALPMIRKEKPDVLITDIKMPFMDGLSLSKLIRKEMPDIKIVIISGYDDFTYAQQAISLGVEQYLLKPITKTGFIEVLEEINEKYEKANEQKKYYEKFQIEMQEYEKNSRRDFFEMLVSGRGDLQKIYHRAEKLEIDIMAESYNIVLFTINSNIREQMEQDTYSQDSADMQDKIDVLFQNMQEYLLFRNQMFSYAVLVKGSMNQIGSLTDECVKKLQDTFSHSEKSMDWFICTGKAVERLSLLQESYQTATETFIYHYVEKSHVITYEDMKLAQQEKSDEMNLKNMDINATNPDMIRNFLSNALEDEVENFAKNYIQMIGEEALKSKMFRQYIELYVHFCTVSFAQQLGYKKNKLEEELKMVCTDKTDNSEALQEIIIRILTQGIRLRNENSKSRYKNVINTAIEFIDENFIDETITLNKVACVANVSANHFSALFSQVMKQTFIEYLTGLRMQRAKELLRCTDKRSGEIALEIGYKDSHYFSFLFKKLQGCTPIEYRNQKESIG